MSLVFSAENRLRDEAGNSPVAQPKWAGARAVQGTVGCRESMAGCGVGVFRADRGEGEPPGEEDIDLIGLKLGNLRRYSSIAHQLQCPDMPRILMKMRELSKSSAEALF